MLKGILKLVNFWNASYHKSQIEMASPPAKRRRRGKHHARVAVDQELQQELCSLIKHVLDYFTLPCELLEEPQLQQLKTSSSDKPGVYTSDLALRLYHSHIRPRQQESKEVIFPDSTAFVHACIRVLQQALDTRVYPFRRVVKVESHNGIHHDRIFLQTREFATVSVNVTRLEDQISVLYVDESVLVVNKPFNMLSVDGNVANEVSVQTLVRRYYPDARMVHRLDFETSGILLIALTRTATQHLNLQFRERTLHKVYTARVFGHVRDEEGRIELHMAPGATDRLVQCVIPEGESSTLTKTNWSVLERSEMDEIKSTLMSLTLLTGKTHQLRVHMNHIGHSILGDSLYAESTVQQLSSRLLLHATTLEFTHPVDNQMHTIHCKCPF